jgi:RNA polymerase sigma-70 factor (ECF subfamily)
VEDETEPSDAEVIAASLGSPARFAVVYDRYATTVHRYLLRRVGPSDAEGLMAEAFRIAFERRATYDVARPNARPWLYGIATRLVARHWRSESRRRAATQRLGVLSGSGRGAGDDLADPAEQAVDAVAASTQLSEVVAAVRRLPDGERDALLLYAWEDLGYDDVAAALGVPVGTVRSRLNRARRRLRELVPMGGEHLVHADVFTRQKERLMTDITGTTPEPPGIEHRSRMYPRLAYRDEAAALEYLTRVFGFREIRESRLVFDTGMLAWLEFGAGLVMIGRANHDVHRIYSPGEVGHTTTMINVEVDDVDAHYAHSVAEGAEITMPIEDAWYGGRRYEATDLEGHRWHFDESHAHIRSRGGPVPDTPPPMC